MIIGGPCGPPEIIFFSWWHLAFLFPVDLGLFGYTHVHPAVPLPLPASP